MSQTTSWGERSKALAPCRRALGLCASLLSLALLACQGPAPESAPELSTGPATEADGRPNLILLSVDTLRADHLGCYGYPRPTSPNLDRFAATAIRYANAYSPAPWTLPSHAAMLTGVHPYLQGFRHKNSTIPSEVPVVAELLSAAGYRTAAFVDSSAKGYVGGERGFARGFSRYDHAPHRAEQSSKYDMAATVEAALKWLAEPRGERPFFLFLHTKSVHAAPLGGGCADPRCFPYAKPQPYQLRFATEEAAQLRWTSAEMGDGQKLLWGLNERFLDGRLDPRAYPEARIEALISFYDAGIAYVDEQFGRLLAGMERLGLGGTTTVVVTADHGEAFLEHNLLLHQEVYQQLLHVPLIVRPAGGSAAGAVVDSVVALEDVVPTLLDEAGVAKPEPLSGVVLPRSAAGSADGPASAVAGDEPRPLFAYYLFPPNFTYQAFSQQLGDWKLVSHNFANSDEFRVELYNLAADPGETSPLSGHERQRTALQRALRANLRRQPWAQAGGVDESDPDLDAIRALGYID